MIDSEKTANIRISCLVLNIKGNFVEEFYTALPSVLYNSIGADSDNFDTDKIFIGELRGKAAWCWK